MLLTFRICSNINHWKLLCIYLCSPIRRNPSLIGFLRINGLMNVHKSFLIKLLAETICVPKAHLPVLTSCWNKETGKASFASSVFTQAASLPCLRVFWRVWGKWKILFGPCFGQFPWKHQWNYYYYFCLNLKRYLRSVITDRNMCINSELKCFFLHSSHHYIFSNWSLFYVHFYLCNFVFQ